jgi:hypothetical protein
MPDISMCKGTDCPIASTCRRYTARPNPYRQAYFTEVPFKDGKCEMYWGEKAEEIYQQIKNIFNGKDKE